MLIEHRKQEIIKPTTPPPPMAPQVVVMTTHGTTRDENAANPTIPCSHWVKETNTAIIWQSNYQSIKTNYIKIPCTFQWCMYHSKIGCKYLANRAPKNKRSSSWQPHRWHRNLSNDKSWCQQRRKSRQLDDPLLSMRKALNSRNSIINTYGYSITIDDPLTVWSFIVVLSFSSMRLFVMHFSLIMIAKLFLS